MATPAPAPAATAISVGIITISDRASAGVYEDHGGPALKKASVAQGWNVEAEAVVPDDVVAIQQAVLSFAAQGCGLILTTGGTGIAERDVTPEAIRGIMRVEIPGFGELMRMKSLEITPNAILSRCLAAVVRHSLVLALPGKPSGAVECLGFVLGAIPHTVKVVRKEPTSC
jgi:molybdopterin adenylyltransferase